MTKEEALHRVKGYLTDIIPVEDYSEVEEIIKALEQEPILDKIRAEIEELADADGYGDYQLGFSFGLMMAMEIIDKYRAEGSRE